MSSVCCVMLMYVSSLYVTYYVNIRYHSVPFSNKDSVKSGFYNQLCLKCNKMVYLKAGVST